MGDEGWAAFHVQRLAAGEVFDRPCRSANGNCDCVDLAELCRGLSKPDWSSVVPGTKLKCRARSGVAHLAGPASRRRLPVAPSATPGAQDDIGDVRRAGRRVDARLNRMQFDREVAAEQPAEIVGIDVIRRIDSP